MHRSEIRRACGACEHRFKERDQLGQYGAVESNERRGHYRFAGIQQL